MKRTVAKDRVRAEVLGKIVEGLNRPVISMSQIKYTKKTVRTLNVGFRLWEIGLVLGGLWLTGVLRDGIVKFTPSSKALIAEVAKKTPGALLKLPPIDELMKSITP